MTKFIGKFGFLACRKIKNQKKSLKLAKDIMNQSEKIIITLEDDDFIEMIKRKFSNGDHKEVLRKKLEILLLNQK
ncbi:hypothetical protein ES703_61723 [subsurface metagenome]